MIKQVIETKTVKMQSPYNPMLPEKARKIGGEWDGTYWVFNIRVLGDVNDLYDLIYGEHGQEDVKRCVVTLKFDKYYEAKSGVYFFGKLIARATGRDSGIREYGKDAVIKGNADSCGSFKNWATEVDGEVDLYDVPVLIAENWKDWIEKEDRVEIVKIKEQNPV